MYAVDEGYKLPKTEEIVPVADSPKPTQQACPSQSELTVDVHPSAPLPLTEMQPPAPETTTIQELKNDSPSTCNLNIPGNTVRPVEEPAHPATTVQEEIDLPREDITNKESDLLATGEGFLHEIPDLPERHDSGPSASNKTYVLQNTIMASPGKPIGPTHIILERGFDVFPALCHIVERCPKTVCIYNYPGTVLTTTNIANMLRKNTKLHVMIPKSAKQEKLTIAVKDFDSTSSGILLWNGSKRLHEISGLADSPDIQLVHIGEPGQQNIGIVCSKITTILAKSDLGQSRGDTKKHYLLDALNDICNQQGPTSPLEPSRIWLRSRLSQDTFARGMYWDWIVQRRKQNPSLGAVEIVRYANRFAEEFLLRGEGKDYGDPVGGRIPVSESNVKGFKMEAAVKAGILLIC
ncbi:hypothetical protein OPQ81_003150 [Rhizoctonia solani]|nr:hypothetical protein OPQ81_003150 [Rhizoctonia solani]